MKVGLFIPCYIDQMYPEVALSTYKLLEKLGVDVEYPLDQTCCGQPLYNSGCFDECKPLANKFIKIFKDFDYIVAPSGSCISMVKHNYTKLDPDADKIYNKSYELVEFLHDVLKVEKLEASFTGTVGIHNSCHAHRELNLASKSELHESPYSKIRHLLSFVNDINIKPLNRVDECCGFGGTFSVNEPEVSTQMGRDRLNDHIENGIEYITGVDVSCMMHMQGLIDREKLPIKTIHISQILLGEESK